MTNIDSEVSALAQNPSSSLSANVEVTPASVSAPTFAAAQTITWTPQNTCQRVTLTANITSLAFSGGVVGKVYELQLAQDATGGRTLAGVPSTIKFAGGQSTLSVTPSVIDIFRFRFDGTNYQEVSRAMSLGSFPTAPLVIGSSIDIGNNNSNQTVDSEVRINPPTGKNATLKWNYAGATKWQAYTGAVGTSLFIRDMVNAAMAVEFVPGSGTAARAKFQGTVEAASYLKCQAAATGSRPSASTAGAGASWYDSTLSKPIFSDGTTWRDAAGTAV